MKRLQLVSQRVGPLVYLDGFSKWHEVAVFGTVSESNQCTASHGSQVKQLKTFEKNCRYLVLTHNHLDGLLLIIG